MNAANPRRFLKVATALLIAAFAVPGSVGIAQETSEMEAVKAANQAFYSAISGRDIAAMQKAWSADPDIQYIAPYRKGITVGWEAQKKGYEVTFPRRLPSFRVDMEQARFKINGTVAWVSGMEHAQLENKEGKIVHATNLVTNIFQKEAGGWRMVYHHASVIPSGAEP